MGFLKDFPYRKVPQGSARFREGSAGSVKVLQGSLRFLKDFPCWQGSARFREGSARFREGSARFRNGFLKDFPLGRFRKVPRRFRKVPRARFRNGFLKDFPLGRFRKVPQRFREVPRGSAGFREGSAGFRKVPQWFS